MPSAWFLPFLLQAALMGVDEAYFHRRRGLGRWERWGHPLDTLAFLACLAWLFLVPPGSESATWGYAGLGAFSSLLVTKDEWVHHRECEPAEQWLHSVLFVIHPVVLAAAFRLWPALHPQAAESAMAPAGAAWVLGATAVGATLMLLHQALYWNFLRGRRSVPG